ncbi:hypothetical protein PIB30_004058 [Stylosanthes scabra]|uniref:Uncharacterized protein n=1 Tax=Stylosanthes scabra TaxID=79078 RepID=A0ABU6Y5E1_9FABA|nr:hypothetical protein [Stylosanthes scabra]
MDVDVVKFEDLVKMLNSLRLIGDAGILMLCNNVKSKIAVSNKFHIYVEYGVDEPHLAEGPLAVNMKTINLDELTFSSSSDDGGYESAADEAYKPPPVYEGDTDSNDDYDIEGGKGQKGKKKVNNVPPSKKVDHKGNSVTKGRSNPKKKKKVASKKDPLKKNIGPDMQEGVRPKFEVQDEELVYEYASETLHTPVSSKDEYAKHACPEFNDEYGFGD